MTTNQLDTPKQTGIVVMTRDEALAWQGEVGRAANRLRELLAEGYEREAWRALGFSSWTECIRVLADRYGYHERFVWRLHAANETEKLLADRPVGQISEWLLRPLSKLSDPDDKREAWQMAGEAARNGRVTGADVERAVKELKSQKDGYVIDGPIVSGPVGRYRQNGDVKQCEKCYQLWAAELDYCPYCNISPAARALHLQRENLPVTAANHAISDTPGYDGDEWYTPVEYIEAARALMGTIDLDPASCEEAQEVINAGEIFTKDNDGLVQSWFGNVWLNPPYSMPLIKQFVGKLIAEYEGGRVDQAVIITNNSSDTGWFHDLLSRYPACFTRGRVSFWRPNHEAFGTRQGQTIFYLGNNVADFANTFSRFGIVVVRCDDT